mgnify:CR=1 FL=1
MDSRTPLEALRTLGEADVAVADSAGCAELLRHAKRVRGWVDAVEAAVTSRLRELHDQHGEAPPADQHARCGGVSSAEGKRKERRAETIERAPAFGEALSDGRIGAEHVDALANAMAKLDDDVRDRLLGHADDLLADAMTMSPEQFARSCRDLVRLLEHDQGVERERRQRRDTFLARKVNPSTGMVEGRFAFHPELANQVFGAVDREVAAMIAEGQRRGDAEYVQRRVDRNRLAAEALGRLIAGGHQQARPLEADITLIVDLRTMITGALHKHGVCETSEGLAVTPVSVRQAICNGVVTPIIVDATGNALDAGRTIRTANRSQRRALRAMYRTCAVGDCDVTFDRCEIHHIVPWELGGPTDLHNLVPACSRHHHLVHRHGWQLDLGPDRTLTVTDRHGRVIARSSPDVPAPRSRSHHPPDHARPPDEREPAA